MNETPNQALQQTAPVVALAAFAPLPPTLPAPAVAELER